MNSLSDIQAWISTHGGGVVPASCNLTLVRDQLEAKMKPEIVTYWFSQWTTGVTDSSLVTTLDTWLKSNGYTDGAYPHVDQDRLGVIYMILGTIRHCKKTAITTLDSDAITA